MDLLDVNVLVNAHRGDSPDHLRYADYLRALGAGREPFAVPSIVFSGFLRIVTHPKVFTPPSTIHEALHFVAQIRGLPHCITVQPSTRHWDVFADLCRTGNAKGNLISDAYLAAIAKESGNELVTGDRGFGRWPGLKWRQI